MPGFGLSAQRLLVLPRLVAGQPDAGRLGELRDDEGHQKLTVQ